MKKQSDLSRLMGYAGNYRYFTYASWVLSAVSALVALGYGQTDAAAVIAPMEESLAVDELIRRALKTFTRGK